MMSAKSKHKSFVFTAAIASLFLAASSVDHCYGFTTSVILNRAADSSQLTRKDRHHHEEALTVLFSERPTTKNQVAIEYCAGCRWGLHSFLMAQELLMTFQDDDGLESVTVVPRRPPAPGGTFVVNCYMWAREAVVVLPRQSGIERKLNDFQK